MSTLGKILLLLSLLAAGGYAYLAVQDWQGRQMITAAALRHIVLLQGLPLDGPTSMPSDPEAAVAFRVEMAGDVPTETVSPNLLKAYFTPAGGAPAEAAGQLVTVGTLDNRPVQVMAPTPSLGGNQPVPSQVGEIQRVFTQVKAEVEKADGQAAKAGLLGAWLVQQPETLEERTEILRLVATQNVAELEKRLYARFEQVLAPPKPADAASLEGVDDPEARLAKAAEVRGAGVKDQPERRARIAHLLVHLDQSPGWQKRAMMVVGLRQYVKTVAAQAIRYGDMAARVRKEGADDQNRFTASLADLRGIAIQRTQMVRDRSESRARYAAQVQKDTDFVKQLETHLAELRDQLTRVKADVDELLARQTAAEQQLFAIQQEVGRTLEDIYRLEADLKQIERERYGK